MSTINRREKTIIAAAIVIASLAVIVAANASRPVAAPQPKMTKAQQIARGKYLVTIGGCHDCHTPWIVQPDGKPGPDMSRALSGHPSQFPIKENVKLTTDRFAVAIAPTNTAYSGPWGVSFTANLTPDPETGLGKWTQRNFVETIRTGRHMGRGREVLPPMPIAVYRNFTDADLEAIFSYLQSLPPIRNRVPEPIPPALPVAAK